MEGLLDNNKSTPIHRHKIHWILFMVLLITFSISPGLMAYDFQDESPYKTRLDISCTQLPNQQVIVQAKLRARVDKVYVAVPNAAITIYNLTDSTEVLLGEGVSDEDGIVELMVNAKDQLSINEDGYYSLKGDYEGTDNYKSSDGELLFKPATLEMKAEVVDSIKTIMIRIFENNEDALPIESAEVVLLVPRMFSNLPIASGFTDEDGIANFEFPNNLPGGENGKLTIIAKVSDTDEHASLQSQIENNWGVPTLIPEHHQLRALWSPNAPLWMVLTFAFLMIMVWGHFMIIIYKLYLVRKEGRALSEKPLNIKETLTN